MRNWVVCRSLRYDSYTDPGAETTTPVWGRLMDEHPASSPRTMQPNVTLSLTTLVTTDSDSDSSIDSSPKPNPPPPTTRTNTRPYKSPSRVALRSRSNEILLRAKALLTMHKQSHSSRNHYLHSFQWLSSPPSIGNSHRFGNHSVRSSHWNNDGTGEEDQFFTPSPTYASGTLHIPCICIPSKTKGTAKGKSSCLSESDLDGRASTLVNENDA